MGQFIKENLPDPVGFYEGEGLTLKGRSLWRTTSCPLHGGSDSLRINTETGGFKCMSCYAHGGDVVAFYMARHCVGFIEATRALGAYDDGREGYTSMKPRALPARELLDLAEAEARVVWVVGCDMANRRDITEADRDRLTLAVSRLERINGR